MDHGIGNLSLLWKEQILKKMAYLIFTLEFKWLYVCIYADVD